MINFSAVIYVNTLFDTDPKLLKGTLHSVTRGSLSTHDILKYRGSTLTDTKESHRLYGH